MYSHNSKISIKRINKELEYFYYKKYDKEYNKNIVKLFDNFIIVQYSLKDNCGKTNDYVNIEKKIKPDYQNSKFTKLIYKLSIHNEYPFRPYKIINDNYFLKIISIQDKLNKFGTFFQEALLFFFCCQYEMSPFFLNLGQKCCYCCSTIICENSWKPSTRLDKLLIEYIEISFIEKYLSNTGYKYIMNIYNELINRYNLNNDSLSLIQK